MRAWLVCCADNVSERSTTISTKLQARQDKMEELYRVQALLKKLQVRVDHTHTHKRTRGRRRRRTLHTLYTHNRTLCT